MLKVLMINYEYPPIGGGAATACKHMLEVYAKRDDISVDLITCSDTPKTKIEKLNDKITIYKIGLRKKSPHYWRTIEMAVWLVKAALYSLRFIKNEYDLVHCWAGYPSGLIGYMLKWKFPYIVALRGSDIPGYSKRTDTLDRIIIRKISRIVWKNSEAITTLSLDSSKLAKKTLDTDYKVIINGVDIQEFFPEEGFEKVDPDNIRLVFIGRLIPRKAVKYILEAMPKVLETFPGKRINLDIYGGGPLLESHRSVAKSLGIDSNVVFHGVVPREKVPAMLRKHDIMLIPSLSEALSNVTQESIGSGLVILATDTGAAELIDGNGVVVKKASSEDIAEKLIDLINNPEKIERFKARSWELARGMTWEVCANSYIDLYKEVVNKPKLDE